MSNLNLQRREFLKSSVVTSAGLAISFYVPSGLMMRGLSAYAQGLEKIDKEVPNAFIKITPDNQITLVINKLEMGQGVYTSMAQLIAEELECDWQTIRCVSAPVDAVYNHSMFPMQMTGGSTALNSTWMQYRRVGAMMREMLTAAAAKEWKVDAKTCRAENGQVISANGQKLSYGELAEKAAKIEKPKDVKLKSEKDFKVIGKSIQRVDAKEKSTGTATYGIDVRIPDMVYAVIARPPVFGAKLTSVDSAEAKKIAGVIDVVKMSNSVAVLAKNSWAARKGRDAVKVKWDIADQDKVSSENLFQEFKKIAAEKNLSAHEVGDASKALQSMKHKISADYEFPYLAHASMEPMNCTINYNGSSCEMWAGFQMPTMDRAAVAKVLDLAPEKVKLNTTYAGGSFGRRACKNMDYAVEAAELAKLTKRPLKVFWTREDDMRGGYYRPMYVHQVEAGVDGKGIAWRHSVVGQSVVANSALEAMMVKNGIDKLVVEGIEDSPYQIENFSVRMISPKLQVPTLWWRSVGHTHTAFVMETMMDELAHQAKKDPIAFRKARLKKSPRHVAVLDLLEKHGGVHRAVPKGHALGVAIHESFGSVVGHVAEVSVKDGKVRVHKVVSAVHCGTVVNPDSARMQVEGAIAMGISALHGQITLKDGQVQQGNFNDYPVLRLPEMPKVEVHFVPSHDAPTGLGEPGLPPIGPAVANAVFMLTKKRVRKLPMDLGKA